MAMIFAYLPKILITIDLAKKSKFRNWDKYFFDIKEIFISAINVNKFSSDTIFLAFNIIPDKEVDI